MRVVRSLLLLWALLSAGAAFAQLGGGTRNMAVSLHAEMSSPRAGSTISLALLMEPQPGWHGYWKNPGDAGAETRVQWQLPTGAEAGPLQYPVPDRLTMAGLMNYVFKGPYAHLLQLRLPAGLAPGTALPIRGQVDYLVCTDEICVPERATVALDLRVGDGRVEPAQRSRFDGWRAAMPRLLGTPARFEVREGQLRLAVPLPASTALDDPYLFPLTSDALRHSEPQLLSRNGDLLIAEVPAGSAASSLTGFEGVLRIGDGAGLSFTAAPGEVPPAGTPITQSAGARNDLSTILLALAGAIAGGLLLNIMPCVFPILSLKALSLARAGAEARTAKLEALSYSAGVVLTCVSLGALLLLIRSGGAAVGWAFQLQDPRVILLLLLLVSAIAFNLAGLFHLRAVGAGSDLAASGGTRGAFWTGALAAFVATPCTGPFLGFALGAALVLPVWAALAVFAGLGLGLALPFLLIGFVPAIRRRLPKPGAWMGRLQRLLSIPMFLTALGLAWILGRQSGVDGMALGLAALLGLSLLLWWVGARQQGGKPVWPALLPAAATAAAAIVLVPVSAPTPAEASAPGLLQEEPFSEARLAALRSQGTPVFLYFTADWCITCKVNEEGALRRQAVAESFGARGIKVLVGDWTRGDAEIGRFLEAQGRSGVPLYLFYPAGGGQPEVLPQILTVGRLTDLGA